MLNVLKGVVTLNKNEKLKLKQHKRILRNLASKYSGKRKNYWQRKKRMIVQKGGSFLPFLLTPILGTLFSNLLSK